MIDAEAVLVETFEDAQDFMRWLGEDRGRKCLAFDLETAGLSYHDPIRLAQIGDARTGWAFAWDRWAGLLEEAMKLWRGPWVAHNTLFDLLRLERAGIPVPRGRLEDTLALAHLIDPRKAWEGGLGLRLKELATALIDPDAQRGEAELHAVMDPRASNGSPPAPGKLWTWATVPITFEPYWVYGCMDTVLTAQLWERFRPHIKDLEMEDAYELEMAVLPVLADMTHRGMRVDLDYIERKSEELRGEVQRLRKQARQEYGVENLTASGQVISVLLKDGVKLTERTEKGNIKFDKSVYETLGHPLVELFSTVKGHEKIIGSYFENLEENAVGGVVRANIRQLGARTGRMSVTQPALQTIPSRSGPVVRDAFIPREGQKLVLTDYSSMELRLMAHASGDETLIEHLTTPGFDMHSNVARRSLGKGPDESVSKEERGTAKNALYATQYGAGVKKIAATAKVDTELAQRIVDGLHETYPGMGRFMRWATGQAEKHGYVWGGGRRHLVDEDFAYKATNFIIQSEGGKVLKRKLVALDDAGLGQYLLLPVHDEVVAEAPADIAKEVSNEIRDVMEDHSYTIPLECDSTIADRWGDPYRKGYENEGWTADYEGRND